MTAAILQGLTRNSGIDSVGSITPVDTIAALRALTNAPDTPGNPGLDHPNVVKVNGWATAGDSDQGFFQCVGQGTHASFTATGSISNYTQIGFNNTANFLVITGVVGTISIGDMVSGTGVPFGTTIVFQYSGTTGGAGTYFTNYLVVATGAALTTSSDNAATQFMDASNRLWKRLWDGYTFNAEWAGILPTTTDCGPLMGAVPRFTTCNLGLPSSATQTPIAVNTPGGGVLAFQTYPSQAQTTNVKWRGFSTVLNCLGSQGAPVSNLSAPDLNQICFDITYNPTMPVQNTQYYGGGGYDMTCAGLSYIEGVAILSNVGALTLGIGIRLGSQGTDIIEQLFLENQFMRPANFSVGGFYCLVLFGSPAVNCFLTGLDSCILKGGTIGVYWDQGAPGSSNQGENFLISRTDFAGMVSDALNITGGQRWSLINGSLDYNHRNGVFTNTCITFTNVYHETGQSSTPGALYGLLGESNLTFDSTSSFLGLQNGYFAGDLFQNFGGQSQVILDNCLYFDSAALPYASEGPGSFGYGRQFINFTPGPGIYGNVKGFNGINFVPAISPDNLMNADWNFASGGLSFYPGSSGCTNQTSVVPPATAVTPVAATNAILMSGTASLHFDTMPVKPGMIVLIQWADLLAGTTGALGGSVIFKSGTGTTISTDSFTPACSAPNYYLRNSGVLAPNFTTVPRGTFTQQCFAFRAPSGATQMTGNIATTIGTIAFDPNTKGTATVLSNGNLTAAGSGASVGGVRANGGEITGSFFNEFTIVSATSLGVALVNSSEDLNNFIGGDTNGIVYGNAGSVQLNFSGPTISPYTVGDVVGMAVNLIAQLIWFRVNGGNWNNNGSADPATNTGGISIAGLSGVGTIPMFVATQLNGAGNSVTANFGDTSYAHAAPAGYGNYTASSSYYVGNLCIYGTTSVG